MMTNQLQKAQFIDSLLRLISAKLLLIPVESYSHAY